MVDARVFQVQILKSVMVATFERKRPGDEGGASFQPSAVTRDGRVQPLSVTTGWYSGPVFGNKGGWVATSDMVGTSGTLAACVPPAADKGGPRGAQEPTTVHASLVAPAVCSRSGLWHVIVAGLIPSSLQPEHCARRDIGSLVAEAQAKVASNVQLRPAIGSWGVSLRTWPPPASDSWSWSGLLRLDSSCSIRRSARRAMRCSCSAPCRGPSPAALWRWGVAVLKRLSCSPYQATHAGRAPQARGHPGRRHDAPAPLAMTGL